MNIKELKLNHGENYKGEKKYETLCDVEIPMTKPLFREMWAGMTKAEKRNCLQVTKVREIIEGI